MNKLPQFGPYPSDSFFDKTVQKTLKKRCGRPSWDPANDILDIKKAWGWPIYVFLECDELATDLGGADRHTNVLRCYGHDPLFCSELLYVLAKYYERSYSHPTQKEAMLRCCKDKDKHADVATLLRQTALGQPIKPVIIPAMKWDAIAAEMGEHFGMKKVKGDTLRKRRYPEAVEDREEKLAQWEPHIQAWRTVKEWHQGFEDD